MEKHFFWEGLATKWLGTRPWGLMGDSRGPMEALWGPGVGLSLGFRFRVWGVFSVKKQIFWEGFAAKCKKGFGPRGPVEPFSNKKHIFSGRVSPRNERALGDPSGAFFNQKTHIFWEGFAAKWKDPGPWGAPWALF